MKGWMQVNIVKKKIDDLIPASYNPRKDLQPKDKEYQKIKKSIVEFGYVEPIIYNAFSCRVVGGHQRLKVLKELGYEEVDVVVIEEPEEREKALCIALNKIEGEWDMPLLKDLLQDLDTGALDMDLTGFDDFELEQLMTQFHVEDDDLDMEEEKEPKKAKYNVVVHCLDEAGQIDTYNKLTEQGFICEMK